MQQSQIWMSMRQHLAGEPPGCSHLGHPLAAAYGAGHVQQGSTHPLHFTPQAGLASAPQGTYTGGQQHPPQQ